MLYTFLIVLAAFGKKDSAGSGTAKFGLDEVNIMFNLILSEVMAVGLKSMRLKTYGAFRTTQLSRAS
jgi:hypothetical protein